MRRTSLIVDLRVSCNLIENSFSSICKMKNIAKKISDKMAFAKVECESDQ